MTKIELTSLEIYISHNHFNMVSLAQTPPKTIINPLFKEPKMISFLWGGWGGGDVGLSEPILINTKHQLSYTIISIHRLSYPLVIH